MIDVDRRAVELTTKREAVRHRHAELEILARKHEVPANVLEAFQRGDPEELLKQIAGPETASGPHRPPTTAIVPAAPEGQPQT